MQNLCGFLKKQHNTTTMPGSETGSLTHAGTKTSSVIHTNMKREQQGRQVSLLGAQEQAKTVSFHIHPALRIGGAKVGLHNVKEALEPDTEKGM